MLLKCYTKSEFIGFLLLLEHVSSDAVASCLDAKLSFLKKTQPKKM